MSELNESILSTVAWLAFIPTFPLPGIFVACTAALVSIFGSLRYAREQRTDPIWNLGWVWTSLAVVAVLIYVILGFAFAAGGLSLAAAGLIAWWTGPIAIILFSINEAALSRKRVLLTAQTTQ